MGSETRGLVRKVHIFRTIEGGIDASLRLRFAKEVMRFYQDSSAYHSVIGVGRQMQLDGLEHNFQLDNAKASTKLSSPNFLRGCVAGDNTLV
jgi:hypothetical protein